MCDKITPVEQISLVQRQLVWEMQFLCLVCLGLNCQSKRRAFKEQILIFCKDCVVQRIKASDSRGVINVGPCSEPIKAFNPKTAGSHLIIQKEKFELDFLKQLLSLKLEICIVSPNKFIFQNLLTKRSWCLLKSKFTVWANFIHFTKKYQRSFWTKLT